MSKPARLAFKLFLFCNLIVIAPIFLALVPIVVIAAFVMSQEMFYRTCAGGLLILLSPLIALVALMVLIRDGRPVIYTAERMKAPGQSFHLLKFRTMRVDDNDRGVSGGDKVSRITPLGAFLRARRLDELPQLVNILRGDIGFVGPRPPLRRYVEMFPDLYGRVLQDKPGITGLATLAFHKREEALLSACQTADETETVYTRRCVPRKARLDQLYARHRTICSDFKLMFATVIKRISLH